MSKQQTAVGWLKSNLPSLFIDDSGHYQELFKQALQMEREQIENAYWDGGQDVPINPDRCKQYYEQTYGTDKN